MLCRMGLFWSCAVHYIHFFAGEASPVSGSLHFHLFADDTQLYLEFVPSRDTSTHAISSVESGVLVFEHG